MLVPFHTLLFSIASLYYGYIGRFSLASMTIDLTSVFEWHIIVNSQPSSYYCTYPLFIMLSLGLLIGCSLSAYRLIVMSMFNILFLIQIRAYI